MTSEIRDNFKQLQMSEAPTSQVDRPDNKNPDPTLDTRSISVSQLTFAQMVGQKILLRTLTIDLANLENFEHQIFLNTPNNFMKMFKSLNGISKMYRFIRYSVKFTICIESHYQQVGALMLVFFPSTRNGDVYRRRGLDSYDSVYRRQALCFMPHQFITLGHNGNYQYTMPWLCPRPMLPTTDWDQCYGQTARTTTNSQLFRYDMGELMLYGFTPGRIVAGGFSSFTVRIWAEADVDLSAYAPQDWTIQ